MIIDCHTHTFYSDGECLPSELARRCEENGYEALAITDHADLGNIKDLLAKIKPVIEVINSHSKMKVLPGVEITHVHPDAIKDCVDFARKCGAKVVVVHGETPFEPVYKGTNKAAILSGCDILAHPGLIEQDLASLAAEKGVMLELSLRKGSSVSNGHIMGVARKAGADIIVNSDAHAPSDIFTHQIYKEVALGAGMSEEEFCSMVKRLSKWVDSLI